MKIINYIYEVLEVGEFDEKLKAKEENSYNLGKCDYKNQKIYLAKEMTKERKFNVLVHELTHAYIEASGKYSFRDKMKSEDICEFMGTYGKEIIDRANDYFNIKFKNTIKEIKK